MVSGFFLYPAFVRTCKVKSASWRGGWGRGAAEQSHEHSRPEYSVFTSEVDLNLSTSQVADVPQECLVIKMCVSEPSDLTLWNIYLLYHWVPGFLLMSSHLIANKVLLTCLPCSQTCTRSLIDRRPLPSWFVKILLIPQGLDKKASRSSLGLCCHLCRGLGSSHIWTSTPQTIGFLRAMLLLEPEAWPSMAQPHKMLLKWFPVERRCYN